MSEQTLSPALELCYWLQGFNELGGQQPNTKQWSKIVKRVKAVKLSDGSKLNWSPKAMNPEAFVVWIRGFIDLSQETTTNGITELQWLTILDHLKLVFVKETPTRTSKKEASKDKEPTDISDIFKKIKEEAEKDKPEVNPWKINPWEEEKHPWKRTGPGGDTHPWRKDIICSAGGVADPTILPQCAIEDLKFCSSVGTKYSS